MLIAALTMGIGMFIFAAHFSKEGLIANAYIGPFPLAILLSIKIFNAIRNKLNNGFFIDSKNSNIID